MTLRRSPLGLSADRAAILALCDGTRTYEQISSLTHLGEGQVYSEVIALRRKGHAAPVKLKTRKPTVVYRHFNAAGRLLYVGATANPCARTGAHASVSPWFDEVVRIEIQRFATPDAALAAEAHAIRTENPVHNVQGKPKESAA